MKKVGNFLLLKMEEVQTTVQVSMSSFEFSGLEVPVSDFSTSSCILFIFIFFKLHFRHGATLDKKQDGMVLSEGTPSPAEGA